MSHIIEFSVQGLAGHGETCSQKLNRDVNIFFGRNGSGKTSLLKILHSALEGSGEALRNVPFTAAEVKLYSVAYDRVFTRRVVQESSSTSVTTSSPSDGTDVDVVRAPTSTSKDPAWTTEPVPPGSGTFHSCYLPTSRLYLGSAPIVQEVQGSFRFLASGQSEEELDKRFASSLTRSWGEYSAVVSKEVREAQQKGLANILREALSGSSAKSHEQGALDSVRAYARVKSFLSRQSGFSDALGPEEQFTLKYSADPNFQNVVKDIEEVEEIIEAVTARGERLKDLVKSMFGGGKSLALSDAAVEVRLGGGTTIALPYLSSGEKQLLYMFVETLAADVSSVLIDEPEISMHVDWQKDLVKSLQALNPEAQIILATHSPEVMADVPDDKVFRLWHE